MITIGGVTIKGDVVLSPMAGISDSPYRQITRRFGSAFAYTEFVSTEQLLLGNSKSLDMFRYLEIERPIFFKFLAPTWKRLSMPLKLRPLKNPM